MANAIHTSTSNHDVVRRHHGEETKPSFKTTELVVYVLAVIGVLIASKVLGDA